ncbi:acyl-CoA thioesterase [Akkermansiaceae bacterium]|nr:acyl-CoA thioesterase [Akkermansiaceae bacterium]MDA7888757.1 acyl-CoA thioesterase [Akkermansiaceae bacterium]
MRTPFEWYRPVEFYETDLAGIAHFSNFYRWMESAEHAFLRDRGIDIHDGKIGWPRVNASADFKKPIKFGDEVRVRVSVPEVRTRSVCYAFEFYVNDDDTLRATGKMISVCVELATMKSVEIPADIRAKLEQ